MKKLIYFWSWLGMYHHDRSPWAPDPGQEGITDHHPWPASMVLTLSIMVIRGLQGKPDAMVLFIAGFHVMSPFS